MKKNILLIILFVGLLLYSGYLLWRKYQPEPVRYETVESTIGNIERLAVFTGRIVPRHEVEVRPHIGGVIAHFFVSEGDYVKKGDIIAQIEVIPDARSLAQAEAEVKNSAIVANHKLKEYERNKILYANEVISTQKMESIEADYLAAARELVKAEDDLTLIETGYNAGENTGHVEVRSTINGIVLRLPVDRGATVTPVSLLSLGTPVAVVGDISTSEFVFNVDETEINYLEVDMPLTLALGSNKDIRINGIVKSISQLGEEKKGAAFYQVRASMDVPIDRPIPTRSSAEAHISIARKDNVLLVPESALSFENDSVFVYTVNRRPGGPAYTRKPVSIGLSDKRNVEILSGIESEGVALRGNRIASQSNYE